MNYRKIVTTFAFVLMASLLIFSEVQAVSEVTGTLSAGAATGNSGTISGTVSGGGSGGGGGGSSSGSSSGSVLGSSTTGGNTNTGGGQVLGAETTVPSFPATGLGSNSALAALTLLLSLVLVYGSYKLGTQS